MMREFFDQLIRVTDRRLGPHTPFNQHGPWPNADTSGVTTDNTVEWKTDGYQVFARLFEQDDEMELLAVITAVDPAVDFTDTIERLGDSLPHNIEIELSEPHAGSPVLIALTFPCYVEMTDDELATEVGELLDLIAVVASFV